MNIHKGGAKSLARHPNGRQSGGTKRIKRSASVPIRAGTNNFPYRSGRSRAMIVRGRTV